MGNIEILRALTARPNVYRTLATSEVVINIRKKKMSKNSRKSQTVFNVPATVSSISSLNQASPDESDKGMYLDCSDIYCTGSYKKDQMKASLCAKVTA